MNANDAKRMTEKALADDMKLYMKYFRKTISLIVSEIEDACKEGKTEVVIIKRDMVRHCNLDATRNEVLLKAIEQFKADGFRVSCDSDRNYFTLIWKD